MIIDVCAGNQEKKWKVMRACSPSRHTVIEVQEQTSPKFWQKGFLIQQLIQLDDMQKINMSRRDDGDINTSTPGRDCFLLYMRPTRLVCRLHGLTPNSRRSCRSRTNWARGFKDRLIACEYINRLPLNNFLYLRAAIHTSTSPLPPLTLWLELRKDLMAWLFFYFDEAYRDRGGALNTEHTSQPFRR